MYNDGKECIIDMRCYLQEQGEDDYYSFGFVVNLNVDIHHRLTLDESKSSNRKKSLRESNYKWKSRHIDRKTVEIYYKELDKLILANPTDATYDLPITLYRFLYEFCEAFNMNQEKKDLNKWYIKTTPSVIGSDDYFECDTDTIDSIQFAMEDYLNGELTESKLSTKKSLKERYVGYIKRFEYELFGKYYEISDNAKLFMICDDIENKRKCKFMYKGEYIKSDDVKHFLSTDDGSIKIEICK